ncbi:enoyl-CoA hydratase-related protein [Oxyplasma meridianum]|uniref:Enoyl-CoA hydratase-related protein n=1 Tax=Oxyplasma meridianum TaxID=3073602 RepID=A0AAX4NEW2_9ARCH
MSNIRVQGYNQISFWQEEGVGVIVLRTNSKGLIGVRGIEELLTALSIASVDQDVKSVAITGMNNIFCKGIEMLVSQEEKKEFLDACTSLATLVGSMKKPIFALLNGDAINEGYEIALLCDLIISKKGFSLGVDNGYFFKLGGSLTSQRFRKFKISKAVEEKNTDVVISENDTFLEDSLKIIHQEEGYPYPERRSSSLVNLKAVLDYERSTFLYSEIQNGRKDQEVATNGL